MKNTFLNLVVAIAVLVVGMSTYNFVESRKIAEKSETRLFLLEQQVNQNNQKKGCGCGGGSKQPVVDIGPILEDNSN